MGWNFQLFRGHRQRQGKRRLQHFLSYSAAPDVPCTERGLTTMLHLNSGLFGVVLVLAMATDCYAKSWRGITPLKSTRSDVERLFGKPNDLGRYEIENEHAYIFYSAGPCNGDYQNLSKQKCECLVEKDTVVRIAVTLDRHVVLPAVDKAKFSRAPLRSNTPMSTYSNLVDGIVYMVDDSNQTLTAIDYWPSAADCTQVVASHAAKLQRNSWRGIRPLHSTRDDVERILGKPQRQTLNQAYLYVTEEEKSKSFTQKDHVVLVRSENGMCRQTQY